MLSLARAIPPVSDAGLGWDSNPLTLGCENGVINLTTGKLMQGRREDRVTRTTGLMFDPEALCPRWLQFMTEVFPDPEVCEYMRLAAGYSLTGVTKEQIWFLCHGQGANGKSTYLDLLRMAIGEYGYNMAFSTIEKGKGEAIPSDMAALVGARIVTVSETEEYSRVSEGRLKSITGEDPITARELYKSRFTFTPELKLWLAVNHKPRVADDTEGFWRRVRLVPFTETFASDRRDNNLRAALKAELPGILAWMVRGCVDWHKKGLPIPPKVAVASLQYREESDDLAPFIADCCAKGHGRTVGATALYRAYKQWCERQSYTVREIVTATAFGKRIGNAFQRRRTNQGFVYEGISLLSEGNEPKPYTNVYGSESVYGSASQSNPYTRSRDEKFPENHAQPFNHTLCPCEACEAPDEGGLGCDSEPFWQAPDGGLHCRQCHTEEG
jgi:putative DNA primase/helicase